MTPASFLYVVAAGAAAAWGPEVLSEDEVARRAVEAAPALDVARAEVDGAQASLAATELGLVPEVEVSLGYQRIDGFEDGSFPGPGGQSTTIEIPRNRWSAEIEVQYSIVGILIRRLRLIDAFEARARAQELEAAEREADVVLEAKRRFHTYLGAVETASVARRSLELSEARLSRIRARFEVGEATRADLAGARARRETRFAELVRAEGQRRQALDLLRSYLEAPELRPRAPRTWSRIRSPESGDDARALTERAARVRPAIQATDALIEAEGEERAALWADILPDLRASASYLQANPNPNRIPPRDAFDDSWTVGATLVWSLERALVGSASRDIRASAQARIRAERDDLVRRLGEAVRTALVDLEAAEAVHGASKTRVVAAKERFDATTAAYEVGRVTLDVLLDADVELARARLSVVSALVEHHLARARLERILASPEPS